MRVSISLRVFLISALTAGVLGWVSFHVLRSLNESMTDDMRHHMIAYVVRIVESGPYELTVDEFNSREVDRDDPRMHRRSPAENLWVVNEKGELLATSTEKPLPVEWEEIDKPIKLHDFTYHYRFMKFVPDFILVRLDSSEEVFLLIEASKPQLNRGVLWVQLTFIFFVLGCAVLMAVFLIYIYLKGKSVEAREVLARLENGDLKARFEIKRIDAIGTLMNDFNRMASEIERLVHRVQETEQARTHLLEELGHDIRTPLTSLRTSVETLSMHLDEMPKEEQKEFIAVIRAELSYFIPLIEGLFFIARLAEPRYKKTTEKVDLVPLIREEMKLRQSQSSELQWRSNERDVDECWVLGDSLLLQRVLKNALDNASKMARSRVNLWIECEKEQVTLKIEDDGVGISDSAIAGFGLRKKQRPPLNATEKDVSLGLGSVIIKTILDLHRGSFKIERLPDGVGTRLSIVLQRKP